MKKIIVALTVALSAINMSVKAKTVIKINSQTDFDRISERINTILSKGETDVLVSIERGTYFFKENHVNLWGTNFPDAVLTIEGNGSTIVSAGKDLLSGAVVSPYKSYISHQTGIIDVWGGIHQLYTQIDVLSQKTGRCKLNYAGTAFIPSKKGKDAYIRITEWFRSSIYKIEKVEQGYIYFIADNLARGYGGGWNVNDDYNYGRVFPRFCVFGPLTESAHECSFVRFLSLGYGASLKKLNISGFHFLGNARDGEHGLMDFMSPNCICEVLNCSFEGMKSSRVISIGNKNKVSIISCHFLKCYEDCINASHASLATRVTDCSFENCGLAMTNSFCVSCSGTDAYIADNTFVDFGYSAIGLGYGYKNNHENIISAIAERNKILYSKKYIDNIGQHSIMDSGAIYVSTQNDNTVIRYNTITDYMGIKDNRGIFCDDGANNVHIYGNTVSGIADGNFSIDSRRCANIETEHGSKVKRTNINNRVFDNIVDAPIRFEPREGKDNGCYLGENLNTKVGVKSAKLKRLRRRIKRMSRR